MFVRPHEGVHGMCIHACLTMPACTRNVHVLDQIKVYKDCVSDHMKVYKECMHVSGQVSMCKACVCACVCVCVCVCVCDPVSMYKECMVCAFLTISACTWNVCVCVCVCDPVSMYEECVVHAFLTNHLVQGMCVCVCVCVCVCLRPCHQHVQGMHVCVSDHISMYNQECVCV